ncbi:MAG: sugar-binding domain-containing protein, partial [Bacteroidota bacterium]
MHRFFIPLIGILLSSCIGQMTPALERAKDFNTDWKFSLAAPEEAYQPNFDDAAWEAVQIPHDWSVSFSFDTINGEWATGYLLGGTGWYRKTFRSAQTKDQKVYVYFDGVYNHSEVWINGHKLGYHPYGYTPFYYDLTPHLHAQGESNVIAVKVDRTRYADSRWYTGSGIYRDVQLIATDPLHIPIWGSFVSTPEVNQESALVTVAVQVKNERQKKMNFTLLTEIFDPAGKKVGQMEEQVKLASGDSLLVEQELELADPKLWGIENPQLYQAVSSIQVRGKTLDRYPVTFGIRSFRFDADSGFYLNGENLAIKGVCLHHDAGLVGAAVPEGVWRRRLETLRKGGCNAIRISHNPSSEVLLKLCDEMGFLVQDEFFDEWDYPKDKRLNTIQSISTDYITRGYTEQFQEWAERDLKTTILAHRNHPSVFQWSIGNEIEWTYPRNKQATGYWDANASGNYFWTPTRLTPDKIKARYDSLPALEHSIGETAQKLARWTREMDTTRPVVANCILPSASYVTGYAEALDLIGFSYRRVMYDYGHEYFPDLPIMGTENLGQWHEWKAIQERPFISGTFLWTGTDYLGEAHARNPQAPRRKGTTSGLLDFAGFPKPSYYMMKSLWSEEPTLHISSQNAKKSIYRVDEASGEVVEKKPGAWEKALWVWHSVNPHWNYQEGESVIVEVLSNLAEVELFLNGKSLGKKQLAQFEDHIYKWALPFKAGTLEAKGSYQGEVVNAALFTAGEPREIVLNAERSRMNADGYAVTHVVAQLIDEQGYPVTAENAELEFALSGPAKLLGVDNGDAFSFQDF